MRNIIPTRQFQRDYKKVIASGRYKKEDFLDVIKMLATDEKLLPKYVDHSLTGKWKDFRDCHIKPDWVLIYKKYENNLFLARTGSHSELF